MKRYRIGVGIDFYKEKPMLALTEDPNGEWIKYEDYKELYDTAVGLKLALKLIVTALKEGNK